MRAMSLDTFNKVDEDNEMNYMKERLEATNNLVLSLSKQIEELKESVIFFNFNFTKMLIFNC